MNRTISISLDDDDDFFDPSDRLSTVVPLDLDDDDEFFDTTRMSFARPDAARMSFARPASIKRIYSIVTVKPPAGPNSPAPSYDMWISTPGDLKERRKRLLQGMGLASNKSLLRIAPSKVVRTVSIKPEPAQPAPATAPSASASAAAEPPPSQDHESKQPKQQVLPIGAILLVRSRSDGDIDVISTKTKQRKLEVLGPKSKAKITRTLSGHLAPSTTGAYQYSGTIQVLQKTEKTAAETNTNTNTAAKAADPVIGSFLIIKNLDTGTDFIVKESNEEGMWNKVNDLQTGKQLTMEEFEKSVGHSPVVKELMKRNKRSESRINSHITKSFRSGTKKGSALLKNIKGAASGFLVLEKMEKIAKEDKEVEKEKNKDKEKEKGKEKEKEKEKEKAPAAEEEPHKHSSQWAEAHQHGKTMKEFTALHFSQEIQAHEGSIWTMRFSSDSRFLATAGEDTNVHVWEVQEREVMQPKPAEESSSGAAEPIVDDTSNRVTLADVATLPSEKKKGKKTGKGTIPEYVKLPEMAVMLSEKPKYSLIGHKDEVLDLAWPKYNQLLSSSMDKTVRMWDLETQSCLKIFAHSDYVTCIQFNPVADNNFISGSLDGKLRIWSIPDRHVVDWTDVHEMLTSAAYTPDGQGAIVGTQQGNCKMYNARDSTLENRMDVQIKKKPQTKKFPSFQSQSKKLPGFQSPPPPGKITGFQFAPWNPSEVLITSADSHIGIYNGPDLVQKFRGFKNTSSQISATFCPDGKHVISASEDSQVYIWKVEESKNQAAAKKKTVVTAVNSNETFACKDVSVAITWPGSTKYEAPIVDLSSKKQTKKPTAAAAPAEPPAQDEEGGAAASGGGAGLPPLPKKKKEGTEEKNRCGEDATECPRVPPAATDAGGEGSEVAEASSAAVSEGESASLSRSQSENASGSNSDGGNTVQATAWGLVIVTAGLEGEIKVYQNFGLPVKVARQTLLF